MFKFSNDPQFARKVRDLVGLYRNPPEKALILTGDEESQIQASDRTQPILPLRPGLPARQNARFPTPRDDDLIRCTERAGRDRDLSIKEFQKQETSDR